MTNLKLAAVSKKGALSCLKIIRTCGKDSHSLFFVPGDEMFDAACIFSEYHRASSRMRIRIQIQILVAGKGEDLVTSKCGTSICSKMICLGAAVCILDNSIIRHLGMQISDETNKQTYLQTPHELFFGIQNPSFSGASVWRSTVYGG